MAIVDTKVLPYYMANFSKGRPTENSAAAPYEHAGTVDLTNILRAVITTHPEFARLADQLPSHATPSGKSYVNCSRSSGLTAQEVLTEIALSLPAGSDYTEFYPSWLFGPTLPPITSPYATNPEDLSGALAWLGTAPVSDEPGCKGAARLYLTARGSSRPPAPPIPDHLIWRYWDGSRWAVLSRPIWPLRKIPCLVEPGTPFPVKGARELAYDNWMVRVGPFEYVLNTGLGTLVSSPWGRSLISALVAPS